MEPALKNNNNKTKTNSSPTFKVIKNGLLLQMLVLNSVQLFLVITTLFRRKMHCASASEVIQ